MDTVTVLTATVPSRTVQSSIGLSPLEGPRGQRGPTPYCVQGSNRFLIKGHSVKDYVLELGQTSGNFYFIVGSHK